MPPLSNGWIMIIIWLYIALNGNPSIDCYWVGPVPKVEFWFLQWMEEILHHLGTTKLGFRVSGSGLGFRV